MAAGVKVEREKVDAIVKELILGRTYVEVALLFNLSLETIKNIAKRRSIIPASGQYDGIRQHRRTPPRRYEGKPRMVQADEPPRPVSSFSYAEARRLKARGMGITAIAAMLRAPYRDVMEALAT